MTSETTPQAQPQPTSITVTPIKTLILDAGPLLSLTPLRNLATRYLTTPAVLAELRDVNARDHWERLKLLPDVQVEVREPDALSMTKVMAWAKHTGDVAVLSRTDMGVVALTYAAEVEMNGFANIREVPGKNPVGVDGPSLAHPAPSTKGSAAPTTVPKAPSINPWKVAQPPQNEAKQEQEDAFPSLQTAAPKDKEADVTEKMNSMSIAEKRDDSKGDATSAVQEEEAAEPVRSNKREQVYASEDEDDASSNSDADDTDSENDAEWITPENVVTHKAQDLGLAPAADTNFSAQGVFQPSGKTRKDRGRKNKKPVPQHVGKPLDVACMTGDYAVQNVLMQIGLNLVGSGGKKIAQVKSWVLRCHACFKVCKDPSKKFCPSCGSPSLIRASVTTTGGSTPTTQIHLKQNYQFRTRGTRYAIPEPKMGRAKGQQAGGSGLILREDQKEFMTGMRREDIRRQKEERQLEKAAKAQAEGKGKGLGSWNDPDWIPEILAVGMSGKGRHATGENLPQIGHGRRNPNQVRKTRK
ncbi:hypothetical protein QFC22_000872 [Naganishia vaughanmartiniae]|uniref:Uncharacterized protein n=1 Tax=Naganishia vaughanmartiniae TaxID=1424756 RepID=A0ACC2XLD5_9TREE|nr:hypothetical protein QFC22_000872 [Naganishia vaughanmartiniae]